MAEGLRLVCHHYPLRFCSTGSCPSLDPLQAVDENIRGYFTRNVCRQTSFCTIWKVPSWFVDPIMIRRNRVTDIWGSMGCNHGYFPGTTTMESPMEP
jgi:hypothetical protein